MKIPAAVKQPCRIIEEIRSEKTKFVVFVDNNLGSNKSYLRALCRELMNLDIIWNAAVSLDVTDDPSLIAEMAISGCTGVFIGFESLNYMNIKGARKKSPNSIEFANRVKIFHDVGINVNGSFVFGFDHDTKNVFDDTFGWIEVNKLACATFHILTPYPNTPLFKQLESEDRLLHKDWEKYDTSQVVFQPKHMSCEELKFGYDSIYRNLYSLSSTWKRRPEKITSVSAYLLASILYKKSNVLWHFLIKNRLTNIVWAPLIELSRLRNLQYRKQLMAQKSGNNFEGKYILPGV